MTEQSVQIGTFCNKTLFKIYQYYTAFFPQNYTMRGSRIFSGGSRPYGQKTVWTNFFLVLNLFYSLQRGSNGFITEKTILFQGSSQVYSTANLALPVQRTKLFQYCTCLAGRVTNNFHLSCTCTCPLKAHAIKNTRELYVI